MRIKFYSKTDLSCLWMLQEIEKILKSESHNFYHVNDILELYNIKKFFDNDIFLKSWDSREKDNYISTVKKNAKQIPLFFKDLSNKDLYEYYSQLEREYKNDFWEVLDIYGIIKNNPNLIKDEEFTLDYAYDFLHRKKLLNAYCGIVKKRLLNDPFFVETIISYETSEKKTFYLPEFEKDELEAIIVSYINNENAKINCLDYISEIGKINGYEIDPMIRLEAKKKRELLFSKLPKSNKDGFNYGISVSIKENNEIRTVVINNNECEMVFDEKWLKNHLDYPTILNNFIYIFEFVDNEFRAYFSRNNSGGHLIDLIGLHSPQEYKFGIDKSFLELYSTTVLMAYIKFLGMNNIDIEEIFQWFFSVYLKNEFNIENYVFNKTTKEATYLEKCRMLFAELDGILKQFDFYCKYKKINREALDFYQSVRSSNIKSLIKNKYIYSNNSKLMEYIYLLFSNNSLIYIKFNETCYSSFAELISCEQVKQDVFAEYQKQIINELIENNLIFVENEYLGISKGKYYLFKDLYDNRVISRHHIKYSTDIVEEYLEKGLLKSESTLLTKDESDFYDYMLNNKRFDNSRAIRNSYMHGTNTLDEDAHMNTYYLIIKLILLLIIKINDELVIINRDT